MPTINDFFGFSAKQLKALWVLIALGILSLIYLLISDYSSPIRSGEELTIYVGGSDQTYQTVFTVDLNTSPVDSLELIPGIGPVFSERIIAYRDSAGSFQTTEEITKVRGIGYKLYHKIKGYLKVSR